MLKAPAIKRFFAANQDEARGILRPDWNTVAGQRVVGSGLYPQNIHYRGRKAAHAESTLSMHSAPVPTNVRFAPKATVSRQSAICRYVPILLQKSFCITDHEISEL
jgi:hypothetical protein